MIGVTLEQLREADRSVGIAGGARKYEAIHGALEGGWINVLITDTPRPSGCSPNPPDLTRQSADKTSALSLDIASLSCTFMHSDYQFKREWIFKC